MPRASLAALVLSPLLMTAAIPAGAATFNAGAEFRVFYQVEPVYPDEVPEDFTFLSPLVTLQKVDAGITGESGSASLDIGGGFRVENVDPFTDFTLFVSYDLIAAAFYSNDFAFAPGFASARLVLTGNVSENCSIGRAEVFDADITNPPGDDGEVDACSPGSEAVVLAPGDVFEIVASGTLSGRVALAPVPLPGSFGLLAGGLMVLVAWRGWSRA